MSAAAPPQEPRDDWSTLFEFLPIGAYRSAPDGRQLRANPALVRLNGFSTEAEQLEAVRDHAGRWYVQPGRREEFMALIERDGRVLGFESEIWRHRSGERIWIREHAHAVRDADGQLLYYEGTIEEISDVTRTRQALAEAQARVQELVSLMPGMVYRLVLAADGRRRYSFVSERVRDIYGVEVEEVLRDGEILARLRHPDDRGTQSGPIERALQEHRPLDYQLRILRRDGQVRWIHVISRPAADEDGCRVRIGVLFDITERMQAQQALQQQNELWMRALQASGDGVWDWRVQDGVEVLSPQCKALYGFAPDELPDKPEALDALTHPEDMAQMRAARDAHFAGHTARYVNEHRVRCKDGSWKWILSRGLVIERDAEGRPLRMIGTHADITAAKLAEALRLERDNAAAADRAKSEFLSRVSHELRTPLNAVLGFAQLIELDPASLGERQRGWLQQVLSSGRHLLALLEDVLDLSSLQSGGQRMSVEPVPLAAVVDEAWTMLAGSATTRPVPRFEDELAGRGCRVQADRKRLKQVVSNLLSNAIKYNRPQGWVRVSVQAAPAAADGRPRWELRVADSGAGLDATQLARLFNPFDRLGAERGPVAGTGLGLALSRQLVEAMGGEMGVESTPGVGSSFWVRLPAV
jgi:PAS domain S-box-containing protein